MAQNAEKETLQSIGNWELLDKIAESGLATVYKARSCVSGNVVAVKVMPPFEAGQDQAFQRFARECRILTALNDPHIVRALDFGIDGFSPYLVMEFVEGESLGQRLEREINLPEAEAVRLISQVAGALSRAHKRGLVHRNVNPNNILITPGGQAKLTGLGLVKEVETQHGVTRAGTCLGTPNFIAPEQFYNAGKATQSGDIYALGATLYMAVTGAVPFGGCPVNVVWTRKLRGDLPAPRELIPALTERTDRAIRRAMSTQPDQRPVTCGEFVESLRPGEEAEAVLGTAEPGESEAVAKRARLPVARSATDGPSHPRAIEPTATSPRAEPAATAEDPSDSMSWWLLLAITLSTFAGFACGIYLLARLA